ncbi:MAG TPA: 2-amino-4-hydroxy-6-hydroxymethyldihydropteridine diphosphokinase [Phycisphaerae bacterium]|nr:2-amino-4-hydroxy-6-hydroxymethyldihydropteridine diphosphokinase [Phycisphaerae bacterium]
MTGTVYIALGSNLGDRQANLTGALAAIGRLLRTQLVRCSKFYNTKPVGGPSGQPDYLNAAAELQTDLSPNELLTELLDVEKQFGRDRSREVRSGPRTLDLDILLYDQLVLHMDRLTIPHAHMHERDFVLTPLNEIAPNAVHPVFHCTIAELLSRLANPR